MGRRRDREIAMQILFEREFNEQELEQIVEYAFSKNKLDKEDKTFIEKITFGTLSNLGTIDDYIEEYCKDWSKKRIAKVDLVILRIAIFEMLFSQEVPINVAINEAIELAKKFSTEESPSFVNGILGAISRNKKVEER
ncbi:MAG: transcription antitermination factor NusB [Clostridia bacterium]|nr:transcription antitermination factor NusB [Clostridia bacterium]